MHKIIIDNFVQFEIFDYFFGGGEAVIEFYIFRIN